MFLSSPRTDNQKGISSSCEANEVGSSTHTVEKQPSVGVGFNPFKDPSAQDNEVGILVVIVEKQPSVGVGFNPFKDPSTWLGSLQINHEEKDLQSGGNERNRAKGESSKENRHLKSLKVRSSRPMYVLGTEITRNRVASLSKKALVGKFFYINMTKTRLKQWIRDFWKPRVGYCPHFSLLSNHWICFHFLSEEDLLKILDVPWITDKEVLMFNR